MIHNVELLSQRTLGTSDMVLEGVACVTRLPASCAKDRLTKVNVP